MQPVLFLSHGAPTMVLRDIPSRRFLSTLGEELERPSAVLMISAHWETQVPTLNAPAVNETIHDFYGFARALHEMQYPAPGAPDLAARAADLMGDAGLRAEIDTGRGLDHGAWTPLTLMWPAADIPVAQLSVQTCFGPGHHLQVGQALQALRRQGVLIVASGSFTHNLRALQRDAGPDAPSPEWVEAFADWTGDAILAGRTADLLCYRRLAPFADMAHPSEEHFLPLFVALGAAGEGAKARRIHRSVDLGALRMDSFRFD